MRGVDDEEPSMLADLRWGASSHKDVLDNNYAFMKSCQAQQAALEDHLQQEQELSLIHI